MAAFRELRPSSDHVHPEEAQPSSAASSEAGGTNDPHSANPTRVRKRRAPTHVSQNACTNCKRARAKCDGQEPESCSRCRTREMGDQCHYEVHVKTAKEEMVRRIKSLEQQNAELLGSVKERDDQIEAIFEALRADERGSEVIARLRAGQSYQEFVAWLGGPSVGDDGRSSPGSETSMPDVAQDYDEATRMHVGSRSPDGDSRSRWTFSSPQLTDHLIALFFTWVHPIHMLFSEYHFMKSFSDGDRNYCSPAMVNMMCAMGCHYHTDRSGDARQTKLLQKRFFNTGLAEVAKEDPKSLTSVTTYALLFLVELGSNQARNASSHLRLAAESLAALNRAAFAAIATEITERGIHTLCALWVSLTYQKPMSALSTSHTLSPAEILRSDGYWQPYRYFQDKRTRQVPSQAIATADAMTRLGQIIHDMVGVYCGRDDSVTARSVIILCRRLYDWKRRLPVALEVTGDGVPLSHPLPHVLSLHIHYHVALCQLYRPILELADLPETIRAQLFGITISSALEGLQLLERYRSLYTHRYQNPLLAFCVIHVCETLLRAGRDQRRVVQFAFEATHESLAGFAYVGPLQFILCQTADEEGISLPDDVRQLMGGRTSYGPEEMLDACERVTFTQPYQVLRHRVDRNLGVEFEREWKQAFLVEAHGAAGTSQWVGGGTGSREAGLMAQRSESTSSSASGGSSARSMQINSVVNP
ncbi:Conidial development protein fluffy [Lasiodiplodia theobromae]|uniref:Conidial development protein fluffy n=1 Tax=Lasiodiplodia theobromae TaxID=45133 RepID=A0A5N5DRF2_9PEZI|nr:Conidial development protein fluffy [Lasiodiplodia theobromae]